MEDLIKLISIKIQMMIYRTIEQKTHHDIFKKFSKNSIQTFNKMSVIINRTNYAQGFWATIFWYGHVYFAKSANILLYWQYISLEFQEFKIIVTGL